jgi:hypothetical protein
VTHHVRVLVEAASAKGAEKKNPAATHREGCARGVRQTVRWLVRNGIFGMTSHGLFSSGHEASAGVSLTAGDLRTLAIQYLRLCGSLQESEGPMRMLSSVTAHMRGAR